MHPPGPHEEPPRHRDPNQRVIHATCAAHGAAGFTNLAVTRRGVYVELDPHVSGECLITLDEDAARVLLEALQEWLG